MPIEPPPVLDVDSRTQTPGTTWSMRTDWSSTDPEINKLLIWMNTLPERSVLSQELMAELHHFMAVRYWRGAALAQERERQVELRRARRAKLDQ